MPTTIVHPRLDVSGTGSISTLISTAGTFAGSLTASTLVVTGTATFSGTAVFAGTLQALATATFSATVAFLSGATGISLDQLNSVSLSTPLADGQVLKYNSAAGQWINDTDLSGGAASNTLSVSVLQVGDTLTVLGGATFAGTVSFSATVAFANATVTTLGVSATASFGAEAVFGATVSFSSAIQFNGFPMGSVLLGSLSISAPLAIRFSGSWSDYGILELRCLFKATPSGSVNIDLFTDGGTTAFLTLGGLSSATASHQFLNVDIHNGTAFKGAMATYMLNAVVRGAASATANTAATINCIGVRVGTSLTLSSGIAQLYGRKR